MVYFQLEEKEYLAFIGYVFDRLVEYFLLVFYFRYSFVRWEVKVYFGDEDFGYQNLVSQEICWRIQN